MTVMSWGKGDIPPEVAYWAGLVGIVGAVLLVLAYFAVNVWLKRPNRNLHDEQHLPEEDLGFRSCSGTGGALKGPQ